MISKTISAIFELKKKIALISCNLFLSISPVSSLATTDSGSFVLGKPITFEPFDCICPALVKLDYWFVEKVPPSSGYIEEPVNQVQYKHTQAGSKSV